ncbi:MAG: type II secretion system protein [Oscillospiraceae bacterium]|jgi:type II secretory pathway pseudopilin PulG|nr:type II secretion system protein [Oscillospiraceae bacterium]
MKESRRSGFTLVEALVTTAILIILLAFSAVAVTRYVRWLKITELDNAAREIYLAAENRAVLLSSSGRLNSLLSDELPGVQSAAATGEEAETLHYTYSSADTWTELIPAGSIDPTLLQGYFYVVYNAKGGSVTDVFYMEQDPEISADKLGEFYWTWRTAPQAQRMKESPMIGYYGGGSASNAQDDALGVPIVTIHNGDTLYAEIKYKVLPAMADQTELNVTLTYGGCTIGLPVPGILDRKDEGDYTSFSCTIPLDSLEKGKRFADLFRGAANAPAHFGGDFTVKATLSGAGATSSTSAATDNSLFAKDSSGNTAYIENLRHLQNLDPGHSKVAGKTAAVQTAHIDCGKIAPPYAFVPIENTELKSYDGGKNTIRSLNVTVDSAKGKSGAGLFAEVPDEMRFTNVRMVNAAVEGDGNQPVGALAGRAVAEGSVDFENCWVYWERSPGGQDLRELLGNSDDGYHYVLNSKNSAGGLIGVMSSGSFTDCLAASLIQGKTVGGLAGSIENANRKVEIANSYTDCYLSGDVVGGLLGSLSGGAKMGNCYTAGFFEGKTVSGLSVGGNPEAEYVYTVAQMKGREGDTEASITPIPSAEHGTVFYLTLGREEDQADNGCMTYGEMISSNFLTTMNGTNAGEEAPFEEKNRSASHPYNLQTNLALVTYDFPGLKGLPHYGDWRSQFSETSLVYYEIYRDKNGAISCGFSGGNISTLQNDLDIIEDGYAIAMKKEDVGGESLTITYSDNLQVTYNKNETDDVPYLLAAGDYYLAVLPKELTYPETDEDVPEDFYRSLSFTALDADTRTAAYCPHFAKTVLPMEGEDLPAPPDTVSIRTARQLYQLSRRPGYYGYSFRQELDLDYKAYTGHTQGVQSLADVIQLPVGSASEPFTGSYNGMHHEIRNLTIQQKGDCAALFGVSQGTLRNILLPDLTLNGSARDRNVLYMGALVGHNQGTVSNCAAYGLEFTANGSTGVLYMGGLVGENQGAVSGSEAECALLEAKGTSFTEIYMGGLIGQNGSGGLISASYAVGRLSGETDKTSKASICGLVGENQGTVSGCYSAMDLIASGAYAQTYGLCPSDQGVDASGYLGIGNFTYQEKSFNAAYSNEGIELLSHDELSDQDGARFPRMGFQGNGYPYPTGVRNANGEYVHYGEYPTPIDLGEMGIYYWEKLTPVSGGASSYHVSLLSVDMTNNIIRKRSTLSTTYEDGGVVTEYGYGYYADKKSDEQVKLTAQNIGYLNYTDSSREIVKTAPNLTNTIGAIEENESGVDAVLAQSMPGFTFHSWYSYREAARPASLGDGALLDQYRSANATSGLCPTSSNGKDSARDIVADNRGTFTLTKGKISITFAVNPQFADSMRVMNVDQLNDHYNVKLEDSVPKDKLGSAQNPFQVRCGMQLQEINQMNRVYTDVAIGAAPHYRANHFLYLCGIDKSNSEDKTADEYCWIQTHDIDWTAEGNTYYVDKKNANNIKKVLLNGDKKDDWEEKPGVFFPIALALAEKGNGTLLGWFGGSYNGQYYTIKNLNIDINAKVYATNCMGLFGAVKEADLKNIIMYSEQGSDQVTVRGVENRKSGLNPPDFFDKTNSWYAGGVLAGLALDTKITNCSVAGYTILDTTGTAGAQSIGGAVGGLVGMTNSELTGCTAVTKIQIQYTHSSNAPVRVGGLVGSTTSTITNCYTGGKIEVTSTGGTALHIGGILGGIGMEQFQTDTFNPTVENCYTYITMSEGTPTAYYPIGGSGENGASLSLNNNYYLANASSGDSGARAITYEQLTGTAKIDGNDDIYRKLPEEFQPVTTEVEGIPVAGKYSHPSDPALRGLDYPFPTILKRDLYHVHYGDWPQKGIYRTAGKAPIELDMLVGSTCIEELKTIGVGEDGTWTATVKDQGIVGTVGIDSKGTLTLSETSPGITTLTVTYTVNNEVYTMDLLVNVTAYVELRAGSNRLFTNDQTKTSLTAYGKDGNPLDPQQFPITITSVSTDGSDLLRKAEKPGDNSLALELLSGEEEGNTSVSISYTCTYNGSEYTGMNATTFRITRPEMKDDDKGNRLIIFEGGQITNAKIVAPEPPPDGLTVKLDKNASTVTVIGLAEGQSITVQITLNHPADGQEHVVTVTVERKSAVEPAP